MGFGETELRGVLLVRFAICCEKYFYFARIYFEMGMSFILEESLQSVAQESSNELEEQMFNFQKAF